MGISARNEAFGKLVSAWLRPAFLLLAAMQLSSANLLCQTSPEGAALLQFMASEQRLGSVLTYSQAYVDHENERVSYAGTLYTGVRVFKLDACKVSVNVAVEDRYSGTIEHRSSLGRRHTENTGALKDDSVYEYNFDLNDLETDRFDEFRAAPADLDSNTNLRCQGNPTCSFSWFRIVAQHNAIREQKNVNGFQNLDVRVSSIALPMSSPETALAAAKMFGDVVQVCAGKGAR